MSKKTLPYGIAEQELVELLARQRAMTKDIKRPKTATPPALEKP